jgi:predicted NBD/HSP70 family sugar kinase
VATASARRNGPGEILGLIRRGQVSTRAQVREATGLSRATVTTRIDALLAAGLVREEPGGQSTGGRRPLLLRFDDTRGVVLVAAVDTTHASVETQDLSGRSLDSVEVEVQVTDGPDAVLKGLEKLMVASVRRSGRRLAEVAGVGVSLPAPIDPVTGRPSQPPILPGWDGYPVRDHFEQRFGVRVVVSNDADAMAAGEHAAAHPECAALLLLKVSTGIGLGIVVDGHVYTGVDGGAGDVGHVRLHDADALCRCGQRGCLAAVASGRAVADALSAAGTPASHGRDVAALLAAGDARTQALVRAAGQRIGSVLATALAVLNPGALVVAGDLASDSLLSGLRETIYPLMLPRATRHLEITSSRLGSRAATVGLGQLVVDAITSPAVVDEHVAG